MANPMPTLAAADTLWQFRIPTPQRPPLFARLHKNSNLGTLISEKSLAWNLDQYNHKNCDTHMVKLYGLWKTYFKMAPRIGNAPRAGGTSPLN